MSAVVGMVFDFSSSWTEHDDFEDWMVALCKIFKELNNQPIPYTRTYEKMVFAIGCGAKTKPYNFDILGTIKRLQEMKLHCKDGSLNTILYESLNILEQNGAPYVRNWADEKRLATLVDIKDAKVLWYMLKNDRGFLKKFANEILPEVCRSQDNAKTVVDTRVKVSANGGAAATAAIPSACQGFLTAGPLGIVLGAVIGGAVGHHSAKRVNKRSNVTTDESVKDTVKKGTALVWEKILVAVTRKSVVNVQYACSIVSDYTVNDDSGTDSETRRRMKDLLEMMNIYGGRLIMVDALWTAQRLFRETYFRTCRYEQILFVMAAGPPADADKTVPDFGGEGVTVVSAYVKKPDHSKSRQSPSSDMKVASSDVYSRKSPDCESGAAFHSRLSSCRDTKRDSSSLHETLRCRVESMETMETMEHELSLFCQISKPSSA